MSEMELDFNTDFSSEEEIDEMLTSLADSLNELMIADEGNVSVVNPYRIQQVMYTYKIMRYVTKGTSAKVTYALHEPYNSMGVVTVSGLDISFANTTWFLKAVEFAYNFEVYPKTDGTIEMNFTFHELTKVIK